jgi:hypothetical protein
MSIEQKLSKNQYFNKWRLANLEHHRELNREARRVKTNFYSNTEKKIKKNEQFLINLQNEHKNKMRKAEYKYSVLVEALTKKINYLKEQLNGRD